MNLQGVKDKMTFTSQVKKKLTGIDLPECRFCLAAELAGMVRFFGSFRDEGLCLSGENRDTLERAAYLIKECFGIDREPVYDNTKKLYRIVFDENEANILVLELCIESDVNTILPFDCCGVSFIRGAFLGGGSISNPNKSYHVEFDTKEEKYAKELLFVLEEAGIGAKMTERKGIFVVYIKDFNTVAAVMSKIGADFAALELYNASIEKEIRNDINRMVNCESANMRKLGTAASEQIRAIEKIASSVGLDVLGDALKEMAYLRLEYREDSLVELGRRLAPPIGKSGVNHRLKRIMEFAEKLDK